ncbi:aldehyde dehydrogenase family protein [Nocardia sp. NPDC057030]|uniref:aldehyde dehydrogenase family protein n=1 Tax=unclassified Nocardia TaxID=2637762 RepID=UPI003627AE8B
MTNTDPAPAAAKKAPARKPAAKKAAAPVAEPAGPEPVADAPTVLEVRNPATGTLVGTVPVASADEVAAKVRELRLFQPEWEAIGPDGRKEWLLKFQDWLIDNTDTLADVVQSETGKPRVDSLIDPAFATDLVGYYARRAAKFLADDHPSPHSPLARVKKLTTAYKPYPVVGVITPWNFPLAMPALDVIPALAAGAAVLLKPSEVTPLSALEMARGWAEIGAPPVFAVVTGAGATGGAVVAQADYIQFTGSTATGRKIAVACAERMVPYSLELGGKDPAIVLADADLDRAAHGIAFGGMFNSGQVCISVERVYVEAPVYDEFVAKLTANVKALRQGIDGRESKHDVGALANENQTAIVQRHVDEAVAAGARVLTGGKRAGFGTAFEPTVLVDVDHTMSCITEETFGPTLPVLKVADEAEAVQLANDSIYGLSASVWTGDKDRGERIARQLNAGAVNINDVFSNLFNFALPMGGWGQSGVGARWGGANGVRKYCRQQAITAPMLPTQDKELFWYPYSMPKLLFALGAMRAAGARGLRRIDLPAVLKLKGDNK